MYCVIRASAPSLYDVMISFLTQKGRDGDTFTTTALYRQFLVALLFADLPSLSPSFHEMIFILVMIECLTVMCIHSAQ